MAESRHTEDKSSACVFYATALRLPHIKTGVPPSQDATQRKFPESPCQNLFIELKDWPSRTAS
jgi:hypothetical protein